MDQVFASLAPGKWSDFRIGERKGGLLGRILGYILRGVLSGMERAAARTRPTPDARLFWLSPYVSFAPQARSRPGGALGQPGNFAQPDVLVGLVRRASDHDREPGARKYFGRRFGMEGNIPFMTLFNKDGKRVWDRFQKELGDRELDALIESELAK